MQKGTKNQHKIEILEQMCLALLSLNAKAIQLQKNGVSG